MSNWSIIRATAIAACLVATAPVAAQTAAPAPDPSAARVAMARTLVQTMRTEQQMRAQQAKVVPEATAAFDRMVPMQVTMRAQLTDPQGFARARDEAIKLIAEDRQRLGDETIPMMIDAEARRYAARFTLDELRALNDFYRSPLGQRLIAEQPAIAADNVQFQQNVLAPIGNAHSAALGPKLGALLTPILREAQASATTPPPAAVKKK